ncbi:MAG: glycosyltransferase family 2 protein [Clostridia bacterium]|nr:glycosyltransferase family 2 protein [Clostridia bacterium]MBR5043999.1 glycosyltransferase family 2 protein [Clostridia bacterium]
MIAVFAAIQLIAVLLYLPHIHWWFESRRPQERLHAKKQRRFALLIPARDESKAIAPLLDSVKRQTYPANLIDVHVIVKDPDDPTIGMVRAALPDAVVQVVPNQKRKAEAMDACMQTILNTGRAPDAYLIVDADCLLAANYVEEMNNAMESGADVIIPRKLIKNWLSDKKEYRTLYANCSAMTYTGVDDMGNKSKSKRGYPLALCGQGMLIGARVIEGLGGYPFRSLTEDYELAVECMRRGYGQLYYEYAEIYSEEPLTRREYNKRRIRWLKGFAQFNKTYGGEVKAMTFGHGKPDAGKLHFLYDLYPVYALLGSDGIFFAAMLILAAIRAFARVGGVFPALIWSLLPIAAAYLELFVFGAAQLLVSRGVNRMTRREKIKFLFLFPFVSIEYAWIFVLAFTTTVRADDWAPVARMSIDSDEVSSEAIREEHEREASA